MTSAARGVHGSSRIAGRRHQAFGADADADACSPDRVAAAAYHDARADRHGEAVVGDLSHVADEEVHVPDEVRDERCQRPVVDDARFIELLDQAVFDITATRSDIDSASSWSWVT